MFTARKVIKITVKMIKEIIRTTLKKKRTINEKITIERTKALMYSE